jgi:hypothetical protein
VNSSQLRPPGVQPLVAVVCDVPLLVEAVDPALESFAEVRAFKARGDTEGLLRWLRPDVVIVDTDEDARQAAVVAKEFGVSVLHISVRERTLRVFQHGAWRHEVNGEGPTPESIRNVVAGTLFGRRGTLN